MAITDRAANARRTAADNNCSPLVVRLGPNEPDPRQSQKSYPIAKIGRHAIRQHRNRALLARIRIIPGKSVHLAPRPVINPDGMTGRKS
jgi:hypothetical protein